MVSYLPFHAFCRIHLGTDLNVQVDSEVESHNRLPHPKNSAAFQSDFDTGRVVPYDLRSRAQHDRGLICTSSNARIEYVIRFVFVEVIELITFKVGGPSIAPPRVSHMEYRSQPHFSNNPNYHPPPRRRLRYTYRDVSYQSRYGRARNTTPEELRGRHLRSEGPGTKHVSAFR